MEPKVIYEDESILVLDKPAGWVVDNATTTTKQLTVQNWLGKFKFPLSPQLLRSGIVHRLDKETSGVLLVAKTRETQELLQKQFKERKVEKDYLALVHGKLLPENGIIELPLGRLPWNRERFGVLPGGRVSKSGYSVINYYRHAGETLSLVLVKPKTGRTHQIRIHLKYLGHPVVSDPFYGGRKTSRSDRGWCPRLFLHAQRLKFIHPLSGKEVEFTAKLPGDLTKALKNLQMSA